MAGVASANDEKCREDRVTQDLQRITGSKDIHFGNSQPLDRDSINCKAVNPSRFCQGPSVYSGLQSRYSRISQVVRIGSSDNPVALAYLDNGERMIGYMIRDPQQGKQFTWKTYTFSNTGCTIDNFRTQAVDLATGVEQKPFHLSAALCRHLPEQAALVAKIDDDQAKKDPSGYFDECQKQGGFVDPKDFERNCRCTKDPSRIIEHLNPTSKNGSCYMTYNIHAPLPHVQYQRFILSEGGAIVPDKAHYQAAIQHCSEVKDWTPQNNPGQPDGSQPAAPANAGGVVPSAGGSSVNRGE